MAQLDDLARLHSHSANAADLDWIKGLIWHWYELHKRDEVLTVHFFIFSKTLRIEDFKPALVLMLGPEPQSV